VAVFKLEGSALLMMGELIHVTRLKHVSSPTLQLLGWFQCLLCVVASYGRCNMIPHYQHHASF
jgi:hypothetical protein